MKTFIAAVAMGWLLIWCAEPALAQCGPMTPVYLPDGKVMFCQSCGGVVQCI